MLIFIFLSLRGVITPSIPITAMIATAIASISIAIIIALIMIILVLIITVLVPIPTTSEAIIIGCGMIYLLTVSILANKPLDSVGIRPRYNI